MKPNLKIYSDFMHSIEKKGTRDIVGFGLFK